MMVIAPAISLAAGCGSVRKAVHNADASAAAYSDLQGSSGTSSPRSSAARSARCPALLASTRSCPATPPIRGAPWYAPTARRTPPPAKITDPSTDPDIATESFSFNDPPAIDITTAPLPGPAVALAATSPHSLLLAGNLAPVLGKLTARFGSQDLIAQLAIYPGEVEAVIAGDNGEARAITATYAGALTAGSPAAFEGPRNGIDFSQFVPGVIQRLTELITAEGKARLGSVSRFVLANSLPGGDSGWTIYLTSGSTRFQALVLGNDPQMITPSGTHDLN
ncbi:MAG TPA: hypothetical protein VIL16_37150 [Trebonia sp.]